MVGRVVIGGMNWGALSSSLLSLCFLPAMPWAALLRCASVPCCPVLELAGYGLMLELETVSPLSCGCHLFCPRDDGRDWDTLDAWLKHRITFRDPKLSASWQDGREHPYYSCISNLWHVCKRTNLSHLSSVSVTSPVDHTLGITRQSEMLCSTKLQEQNFLCPFSSLSYWVFRLPKMKLEHPAGCWAGLPSVHWPLLSWRRWLSPPASDFSHLLLEMQLPMSLRHLSWVDQMFLFVLFAPSAFFAPTDFYKTGLILLYFMCPGLKPVLPKTWCSSIWSILLLGPAACLSFLGHL